LVTLADPSLRGNVLSHLIVEIGHAIILLKVSDNLVVLIFGFRNQGCHLAYTIGRGKGGLVTMFVQAFANVVDLTKCLL
jgi:hypothetical protein